MPNWNKYGSTAARSVTPGFRRSTSTPVIDLHAHIFVKAAADFVKAKSGPLVDPTLAFAAEDTKAINSGQFTDRMDQLTDVRVRLADMDKAGIDMQVICSAPTQCYYTLPDEEVAIAAARIVNDDTAAFAAQKPDRFLGLGSVPLQNPTAAIAELRRCMTELGLKGVQILTTVGSKQLSEAGLDEFWREAVRLGAVILMHPVGSTEDARMRRFYFNNVIGNPMETAIALHYLIFDGVISRNPGLKLYSVHGGGYLPFYPGRIDHAWGARSDTHGALEETPSSQLGKVLFDTMVFTRPQLEFLVQQYTATNVIMGTDYPFDMAEYDPVELVESCELSAKQKADVLGGNAARLLGIS